MARVINVGKEAVTANEFELIPTGTKIQVSIFEIDETVTGPNSKHPGEPQFVYTAKVVEEGQFKGRQIKFNYVPLHNKGKDAFKLATFADAVGWAVDKETGAIEVPDNLNDVLGTQITARIGQQASQKINPATDKPYVNNTIASVAPAKSATGAPAAPAQTVSWGTT